MRSHKPGSVTRPFGPLIYKNVISEDWKDEINSAAKSSNIEANHRLVGCIDRQVEYRMSQDSMDELMEHVLEYVDVMCDNNLFNYNSSFFRENKQCVQVVPPWVNVQKKGEWNPFHMHDGNFLSCIVYTQVPEILRDEWKHPTQRGKEITAGKVEFFYGEFLNLNNCKLGPIEPQEKEIYIFPSWLNHYVYPFTADCERISCSTNITHTINT